MLIFCNFHVFYCIRLRECVIPSLKLGTDHEGSLDIWNEEDIEVGANEECDGSSGTKTQKRKADEVVPNNRGLKKKKKTTQGSVGT